LGRRLSHRAELEDVEFASIETDPPLAKENGAGGGELHGQRELVVPSDEGRQLPILGDVDAFDDLVRQHRIDALVVTYLTGVNAGYRLSDLVSRAHELRLTVLLIPRLPEVVNTRSRRHRVGTLPIDELRPVDPRSGLFRTKYALDRILGTAAVIVLAPVLLSLALAVRLSSPGPVLFRQRRVGLDGREFDILKFRSMREAPAQPLRPALTR
jgi:hypothetical protein